MFLIINSFNERKNALDKNGKHNKCVNWKWNGFAIFNFIPFFFIDSA